MLLVVILLLALFRFVLFDNHLPKSAFFVPRPPRIFDGRVEYDGRSLNGHKLAQRFRLGRSQSIRTFDCL